MQPFTTHTGLVMPLDRVNVDTDQMVPKQFLKLLTREGFGRVLFYDWRYLPGEKPNPDFVLNFPRYKGASILLARTNFGCGSSREHAPWGVKDYGFSNYNAPSYADIFYNNCFKNGILPAILTEAEVDQLFQQTESEVGYSLFINLATQTINDTYGHVYNFEKSFPPRRILLKGLDDIAASLLHDKNTSNAQKNSPAMITKPNTTAVVVAVSCRFGHTTLRTSSRRASSMNCQNALPRADEPNTTAASTTPARHAQPGGAIPAARATRRTPRCRPARAGSPPRAGGAVRPPMPTSKSLDRSSVDHRLSSEIPLFARSWQARRESNPQPAVLETAALPIELLA